MSLEFTATDHALLFAWLSRAAILRVGKVQGKAIVREAVRRYGAQRGRRMASRAQANGQPLTMADYLAFGEWQASAEEMAQDSRAAGPNLHSQVQRCPWNDAWEAHDLMPFGGIYCLDIDEALVHGFNPELRLDVRSTLTGGDECCEFVFHGVDRAPTASDRVVMPWEYHLGHLFKAVSGVFVEEMGEHGQSVADEALAEFATHCGQEAAQIVAGYGDTDFDQLPESDVRSTAGDDRS